MKQISEATDSKIAACILTSCGGTPVQCLKDVISKPIEEILKVRFSCLSALCYKIICL